MEHQPFVAYGESLHCAMVVVQETLTVTCRAFDDKELNVIQFYHPLTVIVGHNGSGKTVRSDCLISPK